MEKNSNLKYEISVLQKKYKEKEDEIKTKTKILDKIFEDYKLKIENLINANENGLTKIRELENKIKINK